MKEKNVILLGILFSLLGSFFLIYGDNGNYLDVIGRSIFDGWATQSTTGVSITVFAQQLDIPVPDNGVVVVNLSSDGDTGITKIANLTAGLAVNISIYGDSYPSVWTEAEPNATQAGSNKIEYIEIVVNASTNQSDGYEVHFNITQAQLGDIAPDNISLYIYNDTSAAWQNLTTRVINGTTDPAQFFSIIPHFSKFLIAEKPVQNVGGGADTGGTPIQTGTPGGGGGAPKKITAIEKEPNDVEEEVPEPIHIPGNYFDVSVEIPQRYRELQPGDEVVAEITILNIKRFGPINAEIEYAIEDSAGKVLWSQIETKMIENEITFIKEVDLPLDIKSGFNMFIVRVKFKEDVALAGYPFKVISPLAERAPTALRDIGNEVYIAFFFIVGSVMLYIILLMRKKSGQRIQQKNTTPKKTNKLPKRIRNVRIVDGILVRKPVKQQAKGQGAIQDYWEEMQESLKKRR